jgi:hypothetical protein
MSQAEPKGATIEGFIIEGGRDSSGIFCLNSSPCIIRNIIRDNSSSAENLGGGITLKGTIGSLIRQNRIYDNRSLGYGPAIHIGDNDKYSLGDTICYNLMYHNSGVGDIRAVGQIEQLRIFNNTIEVTSYSAIFCQNSSMDPHAVDVRNNIIFFAPVVDIFSWNNSVVTAFNCTFANAGHYYFGTEEGCVYSAALLADTSKGDYRLTVSSPCFNAGDPAPLYNDPDGSRNDMGAYPLDSRIRVTTLAVEADTMPEHVANHDPAISWSYVSSQDSPLQTMFEIAVGSDSDWTYAEMWNPAPFNSADTFVVYNGSPLVDGATYWLRLRVNNALAWSDWKQISFRMNMPPTAVSLQLPANTVVAPQATLRPTFAWTASSDPDPLDWVTYDLVIALDTHFTIVQTIPNLSATSFTLTSDLEWGRQYWWNVRAVDRYGGSTWSPQVSTFRTLTLGDANNDGVVSIADVVFLANYIFIDGAAPEPLLAGDPNCDGRTNISDAVYLIQYIFSGGPAPCGVW